jgi:hypothetical protein
VPRAGLHRVDDERLPGVELQEHEFEHSSRVVEPEQEPTAGIVLASSAAR